MAVNQFGAGVRFFVDGASQAIRDTNSIAKGFGTIQDSAGNASLAVKDTTMQTLTLQAQFQELQQTGAQLVNFGEGLLRSLFGAGKEVVQLGARMEGSRKQFELAFKDADLAAEKLRAAQDVAAATSLDTFEALDAVFKMQIKGVDGLKEYNGEWSTGGKMIQGQIGSLQLINDLITGSGQDSTNVFRNLNKALSGTFINFRALFDGLETPAEKAAFKAAKTAQDRMDIIMKTVLRTFGGISKTAEGTFAFISANIGDVLQILKSTLGEKLLPALTPLAQKLFDLIDAAAKNEKFISALQKAFQLLVDILGPVVNLLLDLGTVALDIVGTHPGLVKFLGVFILILGVVTVVLGNFLLFVGGVGMFVAVVIPAFISGMAALGTVFAAIAPFILPVLAGILAIVAVVAILRVAWEEDFGGIRTTLFQAGDAFTGFLELVRNWKDGTTSMSKETADALDNSGMFDVVVRMAGFFGSLFDATKKLGALLGGFFADAWLFIKPLFKESFSGLTELVQIFAEMFSLIAEEGTEINGMSKDVSGFQLVLNAVLQVINVFVTVLIFWMKVTKTVVIPILRVLGFVVAMIVKGFLIAIEVLNNYGETLGDFAFEVKEVIEGLVEDFLWFWEILENNVLVPMAGVFNTIVTQIEILLGLISKVIRAVPQVRAAMSIIEFLTPSSDDSDAASPVIPPGGILAPNGLIPATIDPSELAANEDDLTEFGPIALESSNVDIPDADITSNLQREVVAKITASAITEDSKSVTGAVDNLTSVTKKSNDEMIKSNAITAAEIKKLAENMSAEKMAEGFETALSNNGDRHPLTDRRAS